MSSKKIVLTPAQRKAVETRGHTMLVSAAAGSGKTAVLTKRIIELITDKTSPLNVSDLLIVTYTKAAASELKERISKAVYNALKEDPSNKHLSKQLLLLGNAKISTIHSFCSDLIRSNFQSLGLPSNMRIADESESALICNNIMNELIDSCYGGLYSDKISDFVSFVEHFLQGKKDDNLSAVFTEIYQNIRNYPNGIDIFKNGADQLEEASKGDILENKWGRLIRQDIKKTLSYYLEVLNNACDYFSRDEVFCVKYLPCFEADKRICENVYFANENGTYADIKDQLSKAPDLKEKLGSVKSELQSDESEFFKEERKEFWKKIDKISSKYFAYSENTVRAHFVESARISREMYEFLNLFDVEFKKEKIRRGLLDYTDLEFYANKLLYKDDGTLSDAALAIKQNYKEVFIDEYQDVNEMQDRIFTALSTKTNRFMVGDIKQSIYGFRGSEPSLFSSYREAFPEITDTVPESDGVTLYLSDNFRSDRSVIDFSNAIFDVLFNNNSGKMTYTEGDRLVCSKIYGENEQDYDVRVCFIEDVDSTNDGVEKEAEFVAGEVERLVKSGTKPSDITLLFRSRKGVSVYEEALKKRNIQSFNQVDRDFFENDAVLLMLSLLNTIDNPTRDIYLTGTLKSPLFGFSMSDITEIRLYGNECSCLFDALQKYRKEKDSDKCDYFINKLNEWRSVAEGCPVDRLIRHIYNDTHIVELLSGACEKESDKERQANLLLLYEYSRKFENGSFKGLYNFILYLNDVLEKRTTLANARLTSEGDNVVNIMSVHNSKGLEFNTVFYCDTGREFNRMDERSSYIIDKDLGLTLKLRDSSTFGKYNTLPRLASEINLREDSIDEEIRVLYVALTRAKKRLVITSSMKKARERIEKISANASNISHYSLTESKCMSELIMWGLLCSGYDKYSLEYVGNIEECVGEKTTDEKRELNRELIDEYKQMINERLSFEYPYSILSSLPTKLAVSKLYPGVLDELETDIDISVPTMYTKPRFLLPEKEKATAAEKGTATHVFMQFCDFDNVVNNGVISELDRLCENGFMDKRNGELVDLEKVETFFRSNIYSALKKAKQVWREQRFNIKLPASHFTNDLRLKEKLKDESVLVQGVIDLLFVDENDRVILADYKTDSFSNEQIKSGEAERILKARHTVQLSYYAEACKRVFGRAVEKIYVYSFALGKEVEI